MMLNKDRKMEFFHQVESKKFLMEKQFNNIWSMLIV